jgi:hypothetical protein
MIRPVFLRLRRKRAVSTMIGGLIILSLLLTVLGTMVFVSQQYDQYQQIANKMVQYRQQQMSENLVANFPGLIANPGWIGCGSTCNMYNMSLSNLGGVGIQIAGVYITSTGSVCTPLCVLNPSPSSTSYTIKQSTQFLNPGETNHAVLLYLPGTVSLPNTAPAQNTVLIVTSRGNQFSFQWPFQILMGGQSQSAFSAGIMKVAYQCSNCGNPGYDSKNEPGVTGGSSTGQYCHTESTSSNRPGERPQQFTGITVGGQNIGDGGSLWFVNPWITQTIFTNTCGTANGCSIQNSTTLYIYVNITNTGNVPYNVAAGTLDLTWYGSNHIDGALIGIFYNPTQPSGTWKFYPITSTQNVTVNNYFYGIFRATTVSLGQGSTWPPANSASVMFWGSLSLTSNQEGTTFVGGVALSSGLWIRYSC